MCGIAGVLAEAEFMADDPSCWCGSVHRCSIAAPIAKPADPHRTVRTVHAPCGKLDVSAQEPKKSQFNEVVP